MKDIFTDLYNKVMSFFQSERECNTKEVATNRLKLVLMQDRTNLDNLTLQKMRTELVEVISKYVEIDQDTFDVNLEGDGNSIALMLNIPVLRAKTPEEIAETLEDETISEEDNINNDEDSLSDSKEVKEVVPEDISSENCDNHIVN